MEILPDLQSSVVFEFIALFRKSLDFVGSENHCLSFTGKVGVLIIERGLVFLVDHDDEFDSFLVEEVKEVPDGVGHGHLRYEILERPIFEEDVIDVISVQILHVNELLLLGVRVYST